MSKTGSSRQDRAREDLLHTLEACGFNGPQLLERTGLPRRARPALFALMGYVAKAEGRVTGMDIRYAERAMKVIGLGIKPRRRLIDHFGAGKNWPEPRISTWLRWRGKLQPDIPLRVLMLLTPLSYQDQRLSPERIERCENAGRALGLSEASIDEILARFRTKAWITRADAGSAASASFASACQILGGKASDSLDILKISYRRQVAKFHPDKRSHQEHSPAAEAAARERLLELQQAWEVVRKQHPDAL